MSAPTTQPPTTADLGVEQEHASPWLRTLIGLAVITGLADLALQVVAFVPPVLVFGLLTLAGAALAWRRPKAGAIMLLVVSVAAALASVPFSLEGLAHPESPVDFVHALTTIPVRLLAAVAAVATLRRSGGPARLVLVGTGVTVALAAVVGIVGVTTASTIPIEPGDTVVEARAVQFAPQDIAVAPGDELILDNADPIRHTFAVEGTELSVEMPTGATVAVEVDLAPGSYTYLCTVPGHESMTGTLTVG